MAKPTAPTAFLLPAIRRAAAIQSCRIDLRKFLRTYLPERFTAPFRGERRRLVDALQGVILYGGGHSLAFPRGRGATTIINGAALWAAAFGHAAHIRLVGEERDLCELAIAAGVGNGPPGTIGGDLVRGFRLKRDEVTLTHHDGGSSTIYARRHVTSLEVMKPMRGALYLLDDVRDLLGDGSHLTNCALRAPWVSVRGQEVAHG